MTSQSLARPGSARVHFGWLAVVILSSAIGLASMRYMAGGELMAPPPLKANFLSHPIGFYAHIAAGTTALLVGPWQFLAALRRRAPKIHRMMGAIYVMACLTGAAAAICIAPSSNGGWVAASGFLTLAGLWLFTTVMAVVSIRVRDVEAHRRWMRRSFALTLAGVTLRLYLPLAFVGAVPFVTAYAAIAWLCWVPNLLLADHVARRVDGAA